MRRKHKTRVDVIEWISEIESASKEGAIIIVEGKKDRDSLRSAGISGRIVYVKDIEALVKKEGLSIFKGKSFIILTDFDREGSEMASKISREIESGGGRVIKWIRYQYRALGLPDKIEDFYKVVDDDLYRGLDKSISFGER
jgi:5S rRNA maturation endonuclease (ribonuclease M5)